MRTAQNLNSGILPNGSRASLVRTLAAASLKWNGIKTLPGMTDLLKRLKDSRAECLVISDDDTACSFAQSAMRLPRGMPEWLTPMVAVVPGQIFAMSVADVKGFSLDAPLGLTKVTITA